jgi:transposase
VCVRIETKPGEEAQVDFGYAGLTIEPATGKRRKTWVFVMVLSWSRHLFAWLVYDQTVATWLECHRRAFEYFGGVPGRIVLDNLKAAIIRACRDEPEVQRAYREFALHYGFLIDPNPPARPNLKAMASHYTSRCGCDVRSGAAGGGEALVGQLARPIGCRRFV